MRCVLDSSAAFKWVVPERDSDKALRLRADFDSAIHEFLAPDIFPGEVAHALTRAERQARITAGEAIDLWSNVMTSSPELIPSLPLIHRAIAISSQTQVGVFDCLYLALAEREGCEFITADSRVVKGLQKQYPFVVELSSL